MNFSASAHPENTAAEMIGSLRDWWSLSGVDTYYEDQPSALFADQKPTQAQQDLLVSAVTGKRLYSPNNILKHLTRFESGFQTPKI